jgi:hypothetical protein
MAGFPISRALIEMSYADLPASMGSRVRLAQAANLVGFRGLRSEIERRVIDRPLHEEEGSRLPRAC